MRLSRRFVAGGVVLLAVLVVLAAVIIVRGGSTDSSIVTLNCIGGSEKSELMADPQVKQILHDRFGLTVSYEPKGSYDQVQLPTDDLKNRKTDCLWPSSASAQSVFEVQHQGAFSDYRTETVLQSPEVIYAGPQGTDALVRAGIVTQREGKYFVVNMKGLIDSVLKPQTWEALKAGDLAGPVTISSTDPAKSNSGFTLYQLMLAIISTDNVYQAPNVSQAQTGLPKIRQLYDAQGLLARGSDQGFKQWQLQGGEYHAPLYAGYENQIIQQVVLSGQQGSQSLLQNVRILYPEPTLYSDHPVLALNANAGRLIEALKDREIQTIAWQKYGFRSGVEVDLSNVVHFKDLPLVQQLRSTTPPSADVTLMLLNCIKDNTGRACQ